MINVFAWLIFIIPLVSLFFLGQTIIRRYISVALFVTVINTILYSIAWEYNWWRYEESLFNWDQVTPVPIIFSAYWVITIWIFRFTFRKFWVYLIVNIIANCLFGLVLELWRKAEIYSGNMSNVTVVLIFISLSIIIYIFQVWYERNRSTES
ncbi:hypothetical protein J2Z83_003208 [Virgibacillus natechei]|uniref:Uncharacterized protein n=1 Tax=Virgibacillus natechei TaxID=1216297 RepID=A0ABS4IJG5_9BACI|nr:hypothetical protein [Virgibacillus natechei]MBP1971071.1 hypothetical protein [Virgibacillus natechei]UZD13014.1 hypothetical protein OLD84_00080 [Virgibacillus natechei]